MKYIQPELHKNSYNCPYCQVIAEQKWANAYVGRYEKDGQFYIYNNVNTYGENDCKVISIATCNACHREQIWYDGNMLVPSVSNVPMPLEEMPQKVKDIYNEAREVFPISFKAAAALLRLALQHLCVELGGKGENINSDIGKLVKEKGLPVQIQQALDVVRVAGNNAVHPGILDLKDTKTSAAKLFEMINFIVDNQIIQPKKIEEFYNSLPETALDAIEKRDK